MAIEGPLRELALSDVLQLLSLSRKTGVLTVRRDGMDRPVALHLDQGAVVGARASNHTRRLGELLLLAGKVTEAQLRAALADQRRAPGRLLGDLLVDTQGVTADEVQRQLHFQIEEMVFDLARWSDGYFRFEEGPPLDPGPIQVRLSADSLLMEAMRRMDEWASLTSEVADTELVPRLIEGSDASTVLDLQPLEWEVLGAIDGERSLRGIAREVGRAEFDVAKAVFALVSAGVVEVGKRRSAPPRPRPAAPAAVSEEVTAVARALRERRPDEAERLLAPLLRRHPQRGDVLLLRGRLAGMRGQWREAADALGEAVRQDPLLGQAYYHLGFVSTRIGDFARAEDAWNTFLRLPDAPADYRERALRAVRALTELRLALEEEGE